MDHGPLVYYVLGDGVCDFVLRICETIGFLMTRLNKSSHSTRLNKVEWLRIRTNVSISMFIVKHKFKMEKCSLVDTCMAKIWI